MALITDSQREQLLANGAARRRGEILDPYPVVKLHTLDAGACWLLTELAEDGDLAYGLCDVGIGCPALGTVRLSELERVRGPRDIPIRADIYFTARQTLSRYVAAAIDNGSILD